MRASLALAILAAAALTLLGGVATASAASVPSIEAESASNITPTDATLEAQINPNGIETSYQFRLEFGCFSTGAVCDVISAEYLPSEEMPAFSEGQNVSVDLSAVGVTLHPGWEYRYSVEVTNSAGPTMIGSDQTFTTPAPAGPVSIDNVWATGITEHDATLNALINPNGGATTYFFKIYTDGSYDYTHPNCPFGPCDSITVGPPLPPGLVEPEYEHIPVSSSDQSVSLDLASIGANLQPGTTYHYEVVATNRQPLGGDPETVFSPDHTFTTPSEPPGPIPLSAKSLGDGAQSSSAIKSPPSISPSQHQKHKRLRHRAKRAGL